MHVLPKINKSNLNKSPKTGAAYALYNELLEQKF